MAAWAGFSDDDLRRVKNLANKNPGDNVKRPSKSKNTFDSPSTSNVQPKKQFNVRQSPSHKIPKENMAEYTIVETPLECVDIKLEPVETKPVMEELDRETAMNREIKSLEKFREQQQVMEEANKQKKALLAKTLTERKQRARKEAHKLEHIQKELSRLDNLLTADVQVIRGKIEDSSREFLDAQKRFEKAETEYIAAKMSLHDKTELKEQLTEHLYTIIHQNEVRKAKKLADLMKELEMENGENDDLELPQLPPLTTFQPPHMLLSPTGSKSPPGLSRFKIVEDTIFPIAEKSPQTVEAEKELVDKKSEMIIIEPSVRSVQDETNESDDGKGKVKDCDKNGDNTKHKGENPDVNKTQEGLKPDGTATVNDVNSDNDLSVSRDSDYVPTGTQPSELEETGDNCSGSEPLSESSGSVSQHKQSGDKNANTSTTAQGNVTAKSKWEFDGSLS